MTQKQFFIKYLIIGFIAFLGVIFIGSAVVDAARVLRVPQGGTGFGSSSPSTLLVTGSTTTDRLFASSSPQMGHLIATTTDATASGNNIATSTLSGALIVGEGVQFGSLISCDTIDTDSNGALTCGVDVGGEFGETWILDINGDLVATTSVNVNIPLDLRISGGDISLGNGTATTTLTALGTVLNMVGGANLQASSTADGAFTITGLALLEGGLTLQDGDTFTFSGDAFTDFTGDGTISIVSGALRVVDLICTGCIGPTEITDLTLGTDTAGNYADGTAEAGSALTGDTATAFFSAGTIEHERGGLQFDAAAITTGGIIRGASSGVMSILTAGASSTVLTIDSSGAIVYTAQPQFLKLVITGTATSTNAGGLDVTGVVRALAFVADGSTATSTFANGIQLDAGCITVGGTCVRRAAFDNSFQLASSTVDTSLNTFDSASTTFLLVSPSQAGTITTLYCKTDGAEVLVVTSLNGTATSGPPISCNGDGRTVTLTSNNTYAARDDIRIEILATTTANWMAMTITRDEGD